MCKCVRFGQIEETMDETMFDIVSRRFKDQTICSFIIEVQWRMSASQILVAWTIQVEFSLVTPNERN